jgi:predicted dehydrogenase
MAPIRLALIGLSQSAKTSWASEGHLPYLLSERGQQRYKIVGLLNSSEEAARRAISHYGLGSDVKAYGSPDALAADQDVDMVACCTRVDLHYETIRPSIDAGKDVYVEWPLAENVQRATELAELAKQKGVRTVIGLQGRIAPAVLKAKELIRQGRIGEVLSSQIQAFSPYIGRDSIPEALEYFLEKKVGGNIITISFTHSKHLIPNTLRSPAKWHLSA